MISMKSPKDSQIHTLASIRLISLTTSINDRHQIKREDSRDENSTFSQMTENSRDLLTKTRRISFNRRNSYEDNTKQDTSSASISWRERDDRLNETKNSSRNIEKKVDNGNSS